jgi:hypothetical protein
MDIGYVQGACFERALGGFNSVGARSDIAGAADRGTQVFK